MAKYLDGNSLLAIRTYIANCIASAISTVYKFKGSKTVAQVNGTADSGNIDYTTIATGDVYNISSDGTITKPTGTSLVVVAGDNIVWTGDTWDKLAGDIDLSGYVTLAGAQTIEGAKTFLGNVLKIAKSDDITKVATIGTTYLDSAITIDLPNHGGGFVVNPPASALYSSLATINATDYHLFFFVHKGDLEYLVSVVRLRSGPDTYSGYEAQAFCLNNGDRYYYISPTLDGSDTGSLTIDDLITSTYKKNFALSSDLNGYLPLTGGTLSGALSFGTANVSVQANYSGVAYTLEFKSTGGIYRFKTSEADNAKVGAFDFSNLTHNRLYEFPNDGGTIVLAHQVACYTEQEALAILQSGSLS